MGGGRFCGHLVWITVVWSACFIDLFVGEELQDTYKKICAGTASGRNLIGNSTYRYQMYRKIYENCTIVAKNLEIVSLEPANDEYDLSFLESIREVRGYVLILSNFVSKIQLTKLRVIRGAELFAGNYSLYVATNYKMNAANVGLKELQLKSLTEILKGKVFFYDNPYLCFRPNWNYILLNNVVGKDVSKHQITNPSEETCRERGCDQNCTAYDSEKYCWGQGRDVCQTVYECGTNPSRCFRSDVFCHSSCIGGCTGNQPYQCLACRNFAYQSTCVESCQNIDHYDPDTGGYQTISKLTYLSQCVSECPVETLKHKNYCLDRCPTGYEDNGNRECVACGKLCTKRCPGIENESWLDSDNRAKFNECTKIEGHLLISNATFYGHYTTKGINVTDLEILKDVVEITGVLQIDAWHPELKNLSILRNLEYIGGVGSNAYDDYSLSIMGTAVESLDLKSLKQIRSGDVYIMKNYNLCYADAINWTRLFPKRSIQKANVKKNNNATTCRNDGRVCSPLCSSGDGCWGEGDDNCVICLNYRLNGRCVPNCTLEDGFFMSNSSLGSIECIPCHEECDGACNGAGPNQCVKCKNVKDDETCRNECPAGRYSVLLSNVSVCQNCSKECAVCNGSSSRFNSKLGGCTTCANDLLLTDGNASYCISSTAACDERMKNNYFNFSQHVGGNKIKTCERCHPECAVCHSSGPENCIKCVNYKQTFFTGEPMKCVKHCPVNANHYDAGNDSDSRLCKPCHPECDGCNGPSEYDCKLCRYLRIDEEVEEENGTGVTKKSRCGDVCPDGQVRMKEENSTESYCDFVRPPEGSIFDQPRVSAPIFVVLFLIIVAVVVVLVVFWRKQKLRRLKESVLANDEIPMLSATKAPDMSLLRLIKESELRRGNIIGSGAFGTVYKGIWIPEKENVKIPVAIKVLQEASNTNQNVELLDEARIMASVCNPYCVRILAVCMTAQMMLVTQLMPLGCLLEYVRKEKSQIGSRVLLLWSVQIAKGMKYLESLGIVHRDLAARNVLVQSPKLVRITDFGLAKLLDYEEDAIHSEGGKMPIKWLALECIQHRIYTHKSDVWSYGVTLWEMFTYGERPYENLVARQIPNALEKGERLPQPNICTIDVYMILIKCWMLDVESRPTFDELVTEFTRMAQDPGRFLVIPGDTLMRLPSIMPETKDLVRLMSLPTDDEPDLMIMSGDEYLRPKDMDTSDGDGTCPPTSSPLGPLLSIPEDESYENTRTLERTNLENELNDHRSASTKKGNNRDYAREASLRYISDPKACGNDGEKKQEEKSREPQVDPEGYLQPKSVIAPGYLDLVYQTDPNADPKAQSAADSGQQYLDMRPSVGLSKDNPEYYDDDPKRMHTNSNANNTGNAGQPEYYNVSSNGGKTGVPYSRLPESNI